MPISKQHCNYCNQSFWFNRNRYGTCSRYMYNRLLLSLAFLSAWTKLYIFTGLDVLQEKRNAGTADLIMSDLLVIYFFVRNIHCKFE